MPRPDSARALGAYNASRGRPHLGLSAEEHPQTAALQLLQNYNSQHAWTAYSYQPTAGHVGSCSFATAGGPQFDVPDLYLHGTAGIAILAIIAALVLIIGCWYFKRRNGYRILGSRHFSPTAIRSMMGSSRENGECKVPLQDYNTLNNVVPGAPPAYEKITGETEPPPYTP